MCAATGGLAECMRLLLEAGADKEAVEYVRSKRCGQHFFLILSLLLNMFIWTAARQSSFLSLCFLVFDLLETGERSHGADVCRCERPRSLHATAVGGRCRQGYDRRAHFIIHRTLICLLDFKFFL
jgi:hypothetical protein